MNVNKFYETMYLRRITAIALLVRLGNADIPYPHSKHCREQLIYYLTYLLADENSEEEILKIDCEELCNFIDDTESAIMIIKHYSVMDN